MNGVSRTGFGVDVSVTRADELERRLLATVRSGDRVLDLGCGAGGAATRLTAAGAAVTGIDMHDFSLEWNEVGQEFLVGDIRDLPTLIHGRQFDHCLCNRTIHYMRHDDAAQVLLDLRRLVAGQLFISFSGLTSDLARDYAAHHEPIESRFAKLASAVQEIFGITEPLTLYTEAEAVKLVTNAGWNVVWSRTTDFGNVLIEAN